ncbi:MAG: membrane protein insertion efficiency factor YidD [Hyphomicrobiales bacterium]|nr:membrane protein insertion efficiency factor YidD [Hyphomicrobiales bacterium]
MDDKPAPTKTGGQTARQPSSSIGRWPRQAARAFIGLYRVTLSAVMGRRCRYFPTCSEYADEAIDHYGLWAGGWMALARILRCNPWGASGFDPVPESKGGDAAWYLPWRYGRWTGRHIPPADRLDR